MSKHKEKYLSTGTFLSSYVRINKAIDFAKNAWNSAFEQMEEKEIYPQYITFVNPYDAKKKQFHVDKEHCHLDLRVEGKGGMENLMEHLRNKKIIPLILR